MPHSSASNGTSTNWGLEPGDTIVGASGAELGDLFAAFEQFNKSLEEAFALLTRSAKADTRGPGV